MASIRMDCVTWHGIVIAGISLAFVTQLDAQPAESEQGRSPEAFQSAHFGLFTDLPPREAEQALERMEATIEFAVSCWGRPARGRIECYLVHNLDRWNDANLPHPLARVLVGGVGGATLDNLDLGGRQGMSSAPGGRVYRGRRSRSAEQRHAVVYASTMAGVLEHEIMHAYCLQTYGATGPDWYKEGMAELAYHGEREGSGVRCPSKRLQALRAGDPKPIHEILRTGASGLRISTALAVMMARRGNSSHHVSLETWTKLDSQHVAQAQADNMWSWALCHLLHHNPTYRERFRMVGLGYFAQQENAFTEIFGPLQEELNFEYEQFLRHAEVGYRADLCRWDWNRHPRRMETGEILETEIQAARGWQAFDLQVQAGNVYAYRADGQWQLRADSPAISANGADEDAQRGRMVGAILRDYQLSDSFDLGTSGQFIAPTTGQLYLRCQDAWHELGDNSGAVIVRMMRQGSTR